MRSTPRCTKTIRFQGSKKQLQLSVEKAKDLFHYSVELSDLVWKDPKRGPKTKNNVSGCQRGYVEYQGLRYRVTHIIVAILSGFWPDQVRYKNGIVNDNRLENLRILPRDSLELQYLTIRARGCAARWGASWPAFQRWALSTGYKDGMVIMRKDASKPYKPYNCYWVRREEWAKHTTNTTARSASTS